MSQDGQKAGCPRSITAPALVSIAGFAAAALMAVIGAGPWYDEFYTYYVAQPHFGLREALVEHWLPDNHPPLFYALARAFWWLGQTIEQKRLLNVLILLVTVGAGLALVVRRPALTRIAAIFLIFLASQALGIRYVADYRSYFLSLCAMSLMVLSVSAIYLGDEELRIRDRIVLWLAVIVSFNVHITTSIIAAGLLAPVVLGCLVRRDFQRFWLLAPPATVGGLVFVLISVVQAKFWISNTATFWLLPGWSAARWTIEMTAIRSAQSNLVLLAAGVIGLGALALASLRSRAWGRRFAAALLLAVGAAVAMAAILAVHAWRPFLHERYLLGFIPVLAMILALGADYLLAQFGHRWTLAVLAVATVVGAATVYRAAIDARNGANWSASAAFIGRIVSDCPDTAVHTDAGWNEESITQPPPDNRQVVPFAYRMMSDRFGFAREPDNSRRLSAHCPTVFWAEWIRPQGWTASQILRHLHERGYRIEGITVYQFGGSFVAVRLPQQAALPK